MLKQSILIFFILLITTKIFAQESIDFTKANFPKDIKGLKEAQKSILEGNDFYMEHKGGYSLALTHYLKANKFNSENAELNYKIGVCYNNSYNKDKAYEYLKKAFNLKNNVNDEIHLQLAYALQNNLRFDEAIEELMIFKNSIKSEKQKPEYEKIISKRIEECKNGFILVNTNVNGKIINLKSINSEYPDYCPLISADEKIMIFTSRRSNTTGGQRDDEDLNYFEDVYISKKTDTVWSEPVNIGAPINTQTHDATVGLSPDGQELYIYKGEHGGDIYSCKLKGDKWSEPHSLPSPINAEFKESSASISSDGNILYFVSDRNKTTGRDIYCSIKDKKGKWGDAQRLSDVVNTPYDEEGVFIHPDNKTLYFSSKGHKTMGGYDIFYTVLQADGNWSEPKNIGYPINTPDDDVYFTMSANGLHGYFSSIRPEGNGEKDIYLIDFTETVSPMGIANLTIIKGEVKDAVSGLPIEAEIEIVDNSKNELVAMFLSNSSTGEYLVSLPSGKNYGITVKSKDYLFHSENFDILESSAFSEITLNIKLEKMNVGSKMILRNIFFDYASDVIKSESFPELEKVYNLLTENQSMRIEISGHTDNQSSIETNNRLSQERAKAVVDFLIKRGISESRLEYHGYAFSQPIATNENEEGRMQNRRVEFKILSK